MKVGLALSGGGIRGVAHIGAIKALEEHGIVPTHIAGTSSGAVVGALYAAGCTWDEMIDFFKKLELFKLSRYAVNKPGFIDSEKFYKNFKHFLPDYFGDLIKKLFVTATNINDGKLVVFDEGELILPLLASASFPGLFTPVKIHDKYYVDGGILNNFPVDILNDICDRVIGIYVNPFETVVIEKLRHSYSILERAYHIKSAYEAYPKFEDCHFLILPEKLNNMGMFSTQNIDAIFDLGYRDAMIKLDSIAGREFSKSLQCDPPLKLPTHS